MEKLIQPHLIDSNTDHPAGFVFRHLKPRKDGSCLVMLFKTEVEILTESGMEHAEPGDFIMHTPDFPLQHGPVRESGNGFRNDWFYVKSEALIPIAERYSFQFNRLYRTGQIHLLEPVIRILKENLDRQDEYSGQMIRLVLESMLISVIRAVQDFQRMTVLLSARERQHYESIRHCREFIRNNPAWKYNAEELAVRCGLSVRRFTTLYQAYFRMTPFAELMEVRNLLAKTLLEQSHWSIDDIAGMCGWSGHRYFDRIFRKINKVSPSEFRRQALS